jgi:hypothetical protein
MGSRLLFHPMALSGMLLTWVNDHYLKARFGNAFTGKLSDFSGLTFFPFWVLGTVEVCAWLLRRKWRARPAHAAFVALAMALVFSAIKTHPLAADTYRQGVARVQGVLRGREPASLRVRFTRDPTDLVALPMLSACYFVLRRYRAAPANPLTERSEASN